ncbi:MAG: glycosyltransferase family 2 protein [Patescibacteria group bacterium]
MKLSVIIPTFNRADVLRRNLNLLATQTLPKEDFEVIVVDDGSRDETPRLLREFVDKHVLDLKVFTQNNAGQGVARNLGIERSGGEILLFLGDDMLPKPDLLERHYRFHSANLEKERSALGKVTWHPEIRVSRFMRWLTHSGVQFKFHDLSHGEQTDFWRFYTANISIKRELLGRERFDQDFSGWGFEDAELGYRLQEKGMELIYLPAALAEHFHKIDATSLFERQFAAGKNAVLFQKKHPEEAILPTGAKLFVQKLIAIALPFTFYARAKKAFLAGVAAGKREQLK